MKLLVDKFATSSHETCLSNTSFKRSIAVIHSQRSVSDPGVCLWLAVMRTQGSLRVILNTKLWPQMQVDKASEKSLRITAMDTDEHGVKVFLISVRMIIVVMRGCEQ